ncbi:S41 family peptidase [Rufibacter quisquiliarum]|uniref:Tail specific protease domain-containing protein n=1 Tax=Rufibacter quisquiliarum TaxID=1549639 RepID=A0A839GIF9_9BACT|nr:S41 family peptidase [Rufibacter quisquiliarum]MBA9078410.1 hypothetical protein [Rufibacter quisquiliarum]
MFSLKRNLLLGVCLLLSCVTQAQLSKKEKQEAVEAVCKVLKENYVFPEVAAQMERQVRQQMAKGRYDTIASGQEFAFQLTRDLRLVSKDQHLGVSYAPLRPAAEKRGQEGQGYGAWLTRTLKEGSYGVKKKEILPGNIGYLNLPMFGPLDKCADTLIAAMQFVAHTDALILDLRECRGSLDPNTIPFLCGYFFPEPVHLLDIYYRSTNSTRQFWTPAWVPGPRYLEKPLYLLTSGRTFSGGEELAYDLQHLKRATVVGEVTRGGANPAELVRANAQFEVTVPNSRSVNPVTQTNWEQVGVKPDTLVPSIMALYAGQLLALRALAAATADAARKQALLAQGQRLRDNPPQLRMVTFSLAGFAEAKEVAVAGSFNSFARKSLLLKRQGDRWVGQAQVEPGKISYSFIVDGKWMRDPANPETVQENGNVNSLLVVK